MAATSLAKVSLLPAPQEGDKAWEQGRETQFHLINELSLRNRFNTIHLHPCFIRNTESAGSEDELIFYLTGIHTRFITKTTLLVRSNCSDKRLFYSRALWCDFFLVYS